MTSDLTLITVLAIVISVLERLRFHDDNENDSEISLSFLLRFFTQRFQNDNVKVKATQRNALNKIVTQKNECIINMQKYSVSSIVFL